MTETTETPSYNNLLEEELASLKAQHSNLEQHNMALTSALTEAQATAQDLNFRLEITNERWINEVNRNIDLEVSLRKKGA
jgi:uncharacterized ferritin-like protein (DUF455 family)